MANPTPTSTFWDGIHENVHQAFLDALPDQVLDQSLQEAKIVPTSTEAKYVHLKALAEEHLAAKSGKVSQDSKEIIRLTHLVGMLQGEVSDFQGAAATWQQLLMNQHPSRPNLAALYNLSGTLEQQGRYMEAEWMLRAVVPLLQLKIAENSPQAIGGVRNLARCISKQGRKAEAKEVVKVARYERWIAVCS